MHYKCSTFCLFVYTETPAKKPDEKPDDENTEEDQKDEKEDEDDEKKPCKLSITNL